MRFRRRRFRSPLPVFLKLGLIGHPLGHSFSPALHQAALKAAGLPGEYQLYRVAPLPEGEAELLRLLEALRSGELDGLNVTIPHKQNVLPLVDQLSPAARQIGAANLLFRQAGRLVGDNTDWRGFWLDAQHFLESAGGRSGQALVLGAGGSARAVVYALLQAGWPVIVAARRLEQAEQLADGLGGELAACRLNASDLGGLQGVGLVVNTTPVGMSPDSVGNPWPPEAPLPPSAAVYDLVYNPIETALVRQARQAGLPAITGLGMLVEQAALSLERWTGLQADRHAMRLAL